MKNNMYGWLFVINIHDMSEDASSVSWPPGMVTWTSDVMAVKNLT